jgi:hypothetical protein
MVENSSISESAYFCEADSGHENPFFCGLFFFTVPYELAPKLEKQKRASRLKHCLFTPKTGHLLLVIIFF